MLRIHLNSGEEPGLLGNQSIARLPTTNVFPTADGHLQITALTDEQTRRLCTALGCAGLLDEPSFATRDSRVANRQATRERLIEILRTQTTEIWIDRLTKAGVPVAPVARLPEVMADPQLAHRRLTARLGAHPSLAAKTVDSVTSGYITDRDGPQATRFAPLLGEHTSEILAEYGFAAADIAAMHASGLVAGPPA